MNRIKLIAFLFCVAFSSVLRSQSFSLTELISLSKKNIDDFDTYVTTKGYSFYQASKDGNSDKKQYAYKIDVFTGEAKCFINRYSSGLSSNVTVTWQTLEKKDYLTIKAQLKSQGYTFVKSGVFEGTNYLTYANGKYEVELFSGVGTNTTFYEIAVIKQ